MRGIPQLTPEQLDLIRDGVTVLDVREPEELAGGRIPGSINIPLGQLPDRLSELTAVRPIVTVCRSGARSQSAAELLAAAGLPVHNLDGGMNRWSRLGLPTR